MASKGQKAVAGSLAIAMALATPLVMQWEGKRNDPYLDLAGIRTICFGHTGSDIERRRYSDAECQTILERDMVKHSDPLLECVPQLADRPYELAASSSLAFNIGTGAFCRSTVARRFRASNWRGGCDAFLMWVKVGPRTVQGLVNRRNDERLLCLMGDA